MNATCSKMLSKITGKEVADEARIPAVDVLFAPATFDGTGLGHILRMGERRLVGHALFNYVKPSPESFFGDVIDPDVNAAISLGKGRMEWKRNRSSKPMLAPFRE